MCAHLIPIHMYMYPHTHVDVSGLKILTVATYMNAAPPATTSTDWRLKTPGDHLAVGMGGMVCFHF